MIEDDDLLRKLGEIITRLRKQKNLSQVALAAASGCSQMTIQRIESANRAGVRLESLMMITRALNTPLTEIFSELENGTTGSSLNKKSASRWEYLADRIARLNPSVRDSISDFLEKMLDRPWA